LDGLCGTLVQQVVLALALERGKEATERRTPDERAADRREAPP
jgi:hypothetical protein